MVSLKATVIITPDVLMSSFRKSENVSTAEVALALGNHPDIDEA